jgi:hypothetical protein
VQKVAAGGEIEFELRHFLKTVEKCIFCTDFPFFFPSGLSKMQEELLLNKK